jgi:creatinine amidohydrolase
LSIHKPGKKTSINRHKIINANDPLEPEKKQMQWENLTSNEFEAAVKETGVCILAAGVLERHGDHLPLGTDVLNSHKIACLAADQEPAVVFPPFYFGQIYEARCYPGTITLSPTLLMEIFNSVLDEIARNGFKKIIIYNGHGGNVHFLSYLAQCSLWEEKMYSLYVKLPHLSPELQTQWNSVLETGDHYHACECETSTTMANYPDLVKSDRIPDQPADSLNRLEHLPDNYSGIWWYSNYPEHYAGDARKASQAKGKKLMNIQVDSLAQFIAAVKQDQAVPTLSREFFERVNKVGK